MVINNYTFSSKYKFKDIYINYIHNYIVYLKLRQTILIILNYSHLQSSVKIILKALYVCVMQCWKNCL